MKTDKIAGGSGQTNQTVSQKNTPRGGTMMTVTQMGRLLGLKRTESYWLLHKNVFESRSVHGKIMVDIESFEKWYAGQIHYRKVNGEEPGALINASSYSIRSISDLLGISESSVYALIKREHLETVTVDFRMRVPKDVFDQWYTSQDRYQTVADRRKADDRYRTTITVPQMAALLGIPAEQGYLILEDKKYGRYFDCIVLDGQQRITQEDFEAFLAGQSRFRLVDVVRMNEPLADSRRNSSADSGKRLSNPGHKNASDNSSMRNSRSSKSKPASAGKTRDVHTADFITVSEAAELANISRQAISRLAERGTITSVKLGNRIHIRRQDFEKWLEIR